MEIKLKSSIEMKRLDLIEGARGLAAVLVVFYHVARHLSTVQETNFWLRIFQFGHSGVDLFFVISGFIIMHVHFKDIGKPRQILQYAKRRLTRIYPIYWVGLVTTIILSTLGGHSFPDTQVILNSVLLLPSNEEPLLGVAWTLKFEILFYLIFSLLIASLRLGQLVIALWLFCVVLKIFHLLPKFDLPDSIFSTYNIEFFMGMVVAYTIKLYKDFLPSTVAILLIGTFGFMASALIENIGWVDGYVSWMRLPYGISFALLVTGFALASNPDFQLPVWLQEVGAASYSIYLFQFVWIGVAWKCFGFLGWTGPMVPHFEFLILSASGILGGVAMSRLIEYPIMNWIRRRLRM